MQATDAELETLRVLWQTDGLTASEVHEKLSEIKNRSRTTVLSLLQVMLDKGLVRRDETKFPQRYHAAVDEDAITGGLLHDFMERVFGGSARQLLMRLASSKKSSPAEVRQIRKMIKELDREDK